MKLSSVALSKRSMPTIEKNIETRTKLDNLIYLIIVEMNFLKGKPAVVKK